MGRAYPCSSVTYSFLLSQVASTPEDSPQSKPIYLNASYQRLWPSDTNTAFQRAAMTRFRTPSSIYSPLLCPLCDSYYLTSNSERSAFVSHVACQINLLIQLDHSPGPPLTPGEISNWFQVYKALFPDFSIPKPR
jgi:hypothetical protein